MLCVPAAVALLKGTVLLRGCNIADETVGTLVGNGGAGGFPPVSSVVITGWLGELSDQINDQSNLLL